MLLLPNLLIVSDLSTKDKTGRNHDVGTHLRPVAVSAGSTERRVELISAIYTDPMVLGVKNDPAQTESRSHPLLRSRQQRRRRRLNGNRDFDRKKMVQLQLPGERRWSCFWKKCTKWLILSTRSPSRISDTGPVTTQTNVSLCYGAQLS